MLNYSIIVDKLFRVYQYLPHCLINRNIHIRSWRERLNKSTVQGASIISCNCVGGEISSLLNLRFNSPFINVSINRDVFVELCCNLKELMKQELYTYRCDEMVYGVLHNGDRELKIQFPHDVDPEKVRNKWEIRKSRINYEKLVLICDDKGISEDSIILFDSIPAWRKAFLHNNTKKYGHLKSAVYLESHSNKGGTGKYNGKSFSGLYKFCGLWDFVSFLNGIEN